jgi:hypothetical protein
MNKGQNENKVRRPNGKDDFGRLPGRYQILRQHIMIIEMETWSLLGARNDHAVEAVITPIHTVRHFGARR